jgi:hypothetical protein
MWKIGDVQPMKVLGSDGYPYGFSITTEGGCCSVCSRVSSSGFSSSKRSHSIAALPPRATPCV